MPSTPGSSPVATWVMVAGLLLVGGAALNAGNTRRGADIALPVRPATVAPASQQAPAPLPEVTLAGDLVDPDLAATDPAVADAGRCLLFASVTASLARLRDQGVDRATAVERLHRMEVVDSEASRESVGMIAEAIRAAYDELRDEPPEAIAADIAEFCADLAEEARAEAEEDAQSTAVPVT